MARDGFSPRGGGGVGVPAPGAETTINARLACTHGANVCMQLVDSLHNAAGTSGMRMHSPMERKLRDAHGCATHRWVSHPLYQDRLEQVPSYPDDVEKPIIPPAGRYAYRG